MTIKVLFFRSLQQLSECTHGLGADIGTQLERVNQHCITGFPDIHMMLIMTELNGTMEAEAINPESVEQKECRAEVEDGTRVRMTDYLSDYFTDESYLLDALAIGPVATNIGVTPGMQFYKEGVYYNPEECEDYLDEDIPDECLETRSGRPAYTCLKVDTPEGQVCNAMVSNEDVIKLLKVNCAELMPKHCGLFFNPPPLTEHHSITAVGYGIVSEKRTITLSGQNMCLRMRMAQSSGS